MDFPLSRKCRCNQTGTVDHRLALGLDEQLVCAVADLTLAVEHLPDVLTGEHAVSPELIEARNMKRTAAAEGARGHQTEVVIEHDRVGLVGGYDPKGVFDVIAEALVQRTYHADLISAVDAGIRLVRILLKN